MLKLKNFQFRLKVFLAWVVIALSMLQNAQAQNLQKEQKKPTLVSVTPIQSGIMKQNYSYVGSLYFSQKSLLASEISGVLDKLHVSEGQRVQKGAILATLNSDILRNEILSKEGEYQQIKAQYEKIQRDFARYETLYKSASVSFKEYEDMRFDLQAKKGNMDAVAYSLELLKTQQRKKTIVAPYDGVILQKLLQQGEWVSVGASVFNIAKLTPLEATFEVPFSILRSLKLGDLVQVQIAGEDYVAKISALIPLGDAKSRTFPVKLAIEDKQGELIEGLEVRANFNITHKEALLIPRDSILPEASGDVIFIAQANKAKKVSIEVQGYKGLNAYIKAKDWNLKAGEQVIIVGFERLSDGDAIKIQ